MMLGCWWLLQFLLLLSRETSQRASEFRVGFQVREIGIAQVVAAAVGEWACFAKEYYPG